MLKEKNVIEEQVVAKMTEACGLAAWWDNRFQT